jgi:hypothetical protein
MLVLVSLITAILAWLTGWRLFVRSGLPSRKILRTDVGRRRPEGRHPLRA